MTGDERKARDAALKRAVLMAALEDVPFDGFGDTVLAAAAKRCAAGTVAMARLFPDGAASLAEAFSDWADEEMLARLTAADLPSRKVRERIRLAVRARLDVLKPHKEAARRAGAFLSLPRNAPLAARLVWRTADRMWRAAGDTATDFNHYTKRASLGAVYTSTLLRWLNDDSDDEAATNAFLDARIENVMQFEKVKAQLRQRAKTWPALSDLFAPSTRARSRR